MKLKNLILTGLLATAAYKLYKNRDQIAAQVTDTKETIQDSQASLSHTKDQLNSLQEQVTATNPLLTDLQYKLRVFKEESQPHLTTIKNTLAKYKKDDYIL